MINSAITGSAILIQYKNAVSSTDSNLILKDSPTLPCIAPVRNSICFSKSILKVVGTSAVRPGKSISDNNVSPSKLISASSVHASKTIRNRNVRRSKTVNISSVSPGISIYDSNVSLIEHVSRFIVCPSKR